MRPTAKACHLMLQRREHTFFLLFYITWICEVFLCTEYVPCESKSERKSEYARDGITQNSHYCIHTKAKNQREMCAFIFTEAKFCLPRSRSPSRCYVLATVYLIIFAPSFGAALSPDGVNKLFFLISLPSFTRWGWILCMKHGHHQQT